MRCPLTKAVWRTSSSTQLRIPCSVTAWSTQRYSTSFTASTADTTLSTTSVFLPAHEQLSKIEAPPLSNAQRFSELHQKDVRPFSSFLTDTYNRKHDYLRISVTERCNLRCTYCMPEAGVSLSPPDDLLTTPEIVHLSSLFVSQGVTKIRLTGGEPTVRKDILPLMHDIGKLRDIGLRELCITTNGIALHRKLDAMLAAGVTGINLSLDTLNPHQFQIMTRRKGFDAVMRSIERILEMNHKGAKIKLKINCVVIRGVNDGEILPFVEMGRERDLEVRFIEYMPFDGNQWKQAKVLGYEEMLGMIRSRYPDLVKVNDHANDTSKTYQVPGFEGRLGFITSMTHNFCGTCNRLRITSDGNLKVCLFGNSEVSLRDHLRKETGKSLRGEAMQSSQATDSHHIAASQSENDRDIRSMEDLSLLEIIGAAVKRKKARHAGMGELENMKNRPMILIGEPPSNKHTRDLVNPHSAAVSYGRSLTVSHRRNKLRPELIQPVLWSSLSPVVFTQLRQKSSFTADRISLSATVSAPKSLPHLRADAEVHLVSVSAKRPSHRTAIATGSVIFSNPQPLSLIRANAIRKGDVLAVARVAGLQAIKQTSTIIPLAHGGIGVEGAVVKVDAVDFPVHQSITVDASLADSTSPPNDTIRSHGGIRITAEVETTAKTGIEMEALTGVMGAALTIVDMVKGVDREVCITDVKVIGKKGGRSGAWGVFRDEDETNHG